MALPSVDKKLLCCTLLATIIATCVLSVDAIRCHQCNSHLDEDCTGLRLNTPLHQIDEQYLAECTGDNAGVAYCRKTIVKLDVSGETRIVRACGYLDRVQHENDMSCRESDVDGFDEIICSCFHDGCNSAPGSLKGVTERPKIGLLTSFAVILTAAVFRRNA